jgi:ribosomal protein L35AE/L33A
MSKNEDDRRSIKGRLWGCSYNLSETNKLIVEIQGSQDNEVISELFKPEIAYKELTAISSLTKLPFRVGEIFFYKISDWGTVIRGKLLEIFDKHRFNIRYNIDVKSLLPDIQVPKDDIPIFHLPLPQLQNNISNQLNFSI